MEFVRSLGADPLCMVTELPLFLIAPTGDAPGPNAPGSNAPGHPATYLACREALAELALERAPALATALADVRATYGLAPLPLREAIRLQLLVIHQGIMTAEKRFQ
jgi:hypothetical protein